MPLNEKVVELARTSFLRGCLRTELWQERNRIDLDSAEKLLDVDQGEIRFGSDKKLFQVQVLASYHMQRQELMWSWATKWKQTPPSLTLYATKLSDFGAKREIRDLTEPFLNCTHDELHVLGMMAADVLGCEAFFCVKIGDTLLACLLSGEVEIEHAAVRPEHITRAMSRAPMIPSLSMQKAVEDLVANVCGWQWQAEGTSLHVETNSGEKVVFNCGADALGGSGSPKVDAANQDTATPVESRLSPADNIERPSDATTSGEISAKLARTRSNKLYEEAKALHVAKEFNKAILALQQAIAADPTYEWPYLELAAVYGALEDKRRALEMLTAALPSVTTSRMLRRIGSIHNTLKEPDAAIARLKEAIALAPDESASYAHLAYVLVDQGEFAEALESVEKALATDAKNDWAMVIKGRIAERRGNLGDALKYIKRAGAMANLKGKGGEWRLDLERVEKKLRQQNRWESLPTIEEMREYLDRFVCGQERAKMELCTAVYNHYVSVAHQEDDAVNADLGRFNTLIIGPSGCGKTYMIELLTKKLSVPMTIVSATSLVQAGYVGKKVDSIIEDLLAAADYNVSKADRGIVFIDEIDKVKRHAGTSNDIAGEGVQNSLLQMLEGKEYRIETGKGVFTVNSGKILFIAAGAFDGISKITARRFSNRKRKLGFGGSIPSTHEKNDESALLNKVSIEDLEEFGFIAQLTGRFSCITNLQVLTREDLKKILTSMENSVLEKQKKLFALHGIELRFEEDALEAVLDMTNSARTGARGLRAALQSALHTVGWRISALAKSNIGEIVITRGSVLNQEEPKLVTRSVEAASTSPIESIRKHAFSKVAA